MQAALRRGMLFEVCYAGLLRGGAARRQLIGQVLYIADIAYTLGAIVRPRMQCWRRWDWRRSCYLRSEAPQITDRLTTPFGSTDNRNDRWTTYTGDLSILPRFLLYAHTHAHTYRYTVVHHYRYTRVHHFRYEHVDESTPTAPHCL